MGKRVKKIEKMAIFIIVSLLIKMFLVKLSYHDICHARPYIVIYPEIK
jgi:hypothetical protein